MSATGRDAVNVAQTPLAPGEAVADKTGKRKRGGRSKTARLPLETAVRERHDIRNERNPLARRHLPAEERHIPGDELAAKDWTRPLRVDAVTLDVDRAYRLKRGEAQ